jgi:DNA repair photolyase
MFEQYIRGRRIFLKAIIMALNESKGNMYSWTTHTWNTIKGECPHGCTYCYMHRWGKQKPVRLDKKEFKTDLGSGNTIFVGSSCDMFADAISNGWIYDTLDYCKKFNNNYLFQSKNPERMARYQAMMGKLDRVCTTIETNRIYKEMMYSPNPDARAYGLREFKFNRYLTIEPIMDFDSEEFLQLIRICNPVQVNIGADSGNNHLPEPSKEKLLELIDEIKKFTVIDQKRNLSRLLK